MVTDREILINYNNRLKDMEKEYKKPLHHLTINIDLKTWQIIPFKIGKFSFMNRDCRSLAVNIYFLCFDICFAFDYKFNN